MHFELSDGRSVDLKSNNQAAKFIYLAMPFQGLYFKEGQEKPRLIMTPDVKAIIRLSEKFRARLIERALKVEDLFQDEDIPF